MPKGEGNPQLEDGYTKVANEILEAIALTPLQDYESRCIHHLWRQTYGWINRDGQAKKADLISYGQWEKATGISRPHVVRTLKRLVDRQIVVKRLLPGSRTPEWSFNKRWRTWVLPEQVTLMLPNEATPESESTPDPGIPDKSGVTQRGNTGVTQRGNTTTPGVLPNEATTKESIKDISKLLLRKGAGDLLKFLQGLPNWKVTEEDAQWLLDFLDDYPEFNVQRAKACRDWWSGKHVAKDQGAWKNRLRNWLDKGRKIEKDEAERRAQGYSGQPARRSRSTRPGRVPTGDELKEQRRRLGL